MVYCIYCLRVFTVRPVAEFNGVVVSEAAVQFRPDRATWEGGWGRTVQADRLLQFPASGKWQQTAPEIIEKLCRGAPIKMARWNSKPILCSSPIMSLLIYERILLIVVTFR